ncbi:MAG: three-Cys-motif partner protein TcmP [Actinobacteria bacterium]|nr:three-Cys-motif partner protein TcmP [Actinomycetota bacterium]
MTIKNSNRKCSTNCVKKLSNGNCEIPASDNLPVQCVGPWVENKYYFLEKYLNISRAARKKFSEKNNAVYIDLFSGPGKCFINSKTQKKNKEIDNGALWVAKMDEAPFNEFYFCDIDESNIKSLKTRVYNYNEYLYSKCKFNNVDSNIFVKDMVEKLLLKNWRYHFAYIDPFGPKALKFTTIAELSKLNRIDILLHFPLGAIKRNYKSWSEKEINILNNFLGTNAWQLKEDKLRNIYKVLVDTLIEQLNLLGYKNEYIGFGNIKNYDDAIRVAAIKNSKNVKLYELILISKHKIAGDFWNKTLEIGPNGQRKLFS